MICISQKDNSEITNLEIPERVSRVYQEFLVKYDHNPENLVCYVNPFEIISEDQKLISPEGIRIIPKKFIMPNNYYFVPQN